VIPTSIPFDLLVDYLPTVLHASDRLIQGANVADAATEGFGGVIGRSPQIREAITRAKRIALRDVGVLLLGESGVGKDVFARALHAASRRSARPFVAINTVPLYRKSSSNLSCSATRRVRLQGQPRIGWELSNRRIPARYS